MSSSGKLKISLQEILSATDGFAEANVIGKGGYGLVYQGHSAHHGGRLAIKRLNRVHSGQGDHEYGMEVSLLSKYKHENLVSLVGFCGEDGERILVYKYEANQSLDRFLHHPKDLSWMRRLQICLGAARGLRYLHNETGSGHGSVIHRDIKSSNILLDENWNAKISDFGLSKIALTNSPDSVMFTVPCGTMGYIDPQILYGCGITQKSDVYSFGVVLYEVLFGKLVAIPGYVDDGRRFTVAMARKHYQEQTLHMMMIDPNLGNEMSSDSLSTFSDIAYRCLKERIEDRPTMSLVVEALEKAFGYQEAMISTRRRTSSSDQFLYDIFICFYELDTAEVVYSLSDALKREGLSSEKSKTFDSSKMVSPALKQSRSFIIIFSKNFAGDTNRLIDEVAAIIDCVKQNRNVVVMPVYWDVQVSDVREQKGYFGDVLYTMYAFLLDRLKNALVEATNYEPGFDMSDIVEKVKFRNDVVDATKAAAKIKRRLLGGDSVLKCSHHACAHCLKPRIMHAPIVEK